MVSPLQDLCRIPVAIAHANELELKKEILTVSSIDLNTSNNEYNWFEAMEEKVSDTFQKFPLKVREKISAPVVACCLLRSREWAKFHEETFGLPFDYGYYFLRCSFFTSKGMIDKEKAAREILKDTEISSSIRFCLACYYCFSDVIPGLWEQLPEDERPHIDNGEYKHGLGIAGNHKMVTLWSHFLLGDVKTIMKENETFALYKFRNSLGNNDVSFKNCFEELNKLERKEAVIDSRDELNKKLLCETASLTLQVYLPFQPHIEMAIYLLHHLNAKELKVFFQSRQMLYSVLYHLLRWPYQHLFINTVNRFWDELSKIDFCLLLYMIMRLAKDELSSKFCDYRHILKEFWIKSPSVLKRFFFRFEGNYPFSELANDVKINDLERFKYKFVGDYDWFKIIDLFKSSSFTTEDEEIVRLIFGSATLGEKSRIVESNWRLIYGIVFKICDLRRMDLFIECFVPTERVRFFKGWVFNKDGTEGGLWNLILNDKLEEFKKILNWALQSDEEVKDFQQRLLNSYLRSGKFLVCNSNSLKCIDKFLEWSLSTDEIKVLKKSLVGDFAEHCKLLLLDRDFQKIDFYLNWIFSSDIDIIKFKTDLVLTVLQNFHYPYIPKGLNYVKKFVMWLKLSQKECKDLKRNFVLSHQVIDYYSYSCVQEEILLPIDKFIEWAELTETETKHFKKRLVFINGIVEFINRIESWTCPSLISNEKLDFVEELLNWSQPSEEEIKVFYFDFLEYLDRKTKVAGKKSFFTDFLSNCNKRKCKKSFSLQTANVIEYYVLESKWDEVEEVLNFSFSSKNEIDEFKKKFPLESNWLYLKLILDARFDDVDKFLTWTGIDDNIKMELLNSIVFNSRIYQTVVTWVMEKGNEVNERGYEIKRLLNWLTVNDLLLKKWKETFLTWFNESKVEGICFYSDCESEIDVNSFCSSCERLSPSSEHISEFVRVFDEHVNESEENRKRKPESSVQINASQTKKNRRC